MSPEVLQLLDEIRQIMGQYKVEVPGENCIWPLSVQNRVIKLFPEISPLAIAEITGISKSTIYYWHRKMRGVLKPRRPLAQKDGAFLPLKVSSTVEPSTIEPSCTSATLVGPNGLSIKDVTPEFTAQLFRLLRDSNGD